MLISDRFISNTAPSWASVGWRKIASSSSSIRSSKWLNTGKKVYTTVYDRVEESHLERGISNRAASVDAPVDVSQRRAIPVVDSDHAIRHEEDVQLRRPRAVGKDAVHDEIGECVELVDLRSLTEMLRVLHR